MTMKQFGTASRRGTGAVNNPVDVHFEFEVREGEFAEMVAHAPTTGQLALFFAKQYEGGTAGVRAMFDFADPSDAAAVARLSETMSRLGLPIDEVRHVGNVVEGVVTARVERLEQHPDAAKVQRVYVDAGDGTLSLLHPGRGTTKGARVY